VAGLEDVTGGTVSIGDQVVNDVDPKDRDVAMVFQSYALYPHLSVYTNIAFGLKVRHVERSEIDRRVRAAAGLLGIADTLTRRPAELSGGQRQRVALARAIVRDPEAFLLDEPLSNLDARIRSSARIELKRIHQQLRQTFVFVTHDQAEAMTLADKLAIVDHGHLLQYDTPERILSHPSSQYVASFVGSPEMVFLEGMVEASGAGPAFVLGPVRLPVRDGSPYGPVTAGFRPWEIDVGHGDAPGRLPADVSGLERTGSADQLFLTIPGSPGSPSLSVRALVRSYEYNVGDKVNVRLDPGHVLYFNAKGELLDSMALRTPTP
jgi:ABC-type sugar transport system ATPase subunit